MPPEETLSNQGSGSKAAGLRFYGLRVAASGVTRLGTHMA